MSWGYKIVWLYGGFAAFMASLVVFCVRQPDIHLVSPTYYQEEIAYQHQIEMLENARNRQERLQLRYEPKDRVVRLVIPGAGTNPTGEVHFFRPSDARLDQHVPLHLQGESQSIPVGNLSKGVWKVKIRWQEGPREFLEEQTLILP